MAWRPHRVNDGKLLRRATALAMICFGLFGCRSWYFWQQNWTVHLLNPWETSGSAEGINIFVAQWGPRIGVRLNLDVIGTLLLFIGVLVLTYYVIFVNVRSANFLIETEGELRKVTWPAVKPWFKMDTEMWGSSYVVIFLLCLMAVVIGLWDLLLGQLANMAFYHS